MKKRKKKPAIVAALRAIGAFRRSRKNFEGQLEWELSCPSMERAAVPLFPGHDVFEFALVRYVHVLFAPQAVRRVFRSDCWSERNSNGELYPTRNHSGKEWNFSDHGECFVRAGVQCLAVVIDTRTTTAIPWLIELAERIARRHGVECILLDDVQEFMKQRKYRW